MLRAKGKHEIITWGHPELVRPSLEIPRVDAEIRELVSEMFVTMYKARGSGLAAPQIGIHKRLCVIGFEERGQLTELAIINPKITLSFGEECGYDEGCLSIPGLYSLVLRPAGIAVEGIGLDEEPVSIKTEGFLARVLQHEIDHLDGVLFVDRLSPERRTAAEAALERIEQRTRKRFQLPERTA